MRAWEFCEAMGSPFGARADLRSARSRPSILAHGQNVLSFQTPALHPANLQDAGGAVLDLVWRRGSALPKESVIRYFAKSKRDRVVALR